MLKAIWARIRGSRQQSPTFRCATPDLHRLDPMDRPQARIRDGKTEIAAGRDKNTGKVIWLPVKD